MWKLCLNLIDEHTIGISKNYSIKCKVVIMAQSQVEELLNMQPFEKLNERLFRDYWFLFRKEIEEIKNKTSNILDDYDLPDINGSECSID